MNRRIRITAKRRAEVDVDKLVFALLQIIQAREPKPDEPPAKRRTRPKKESAA